MLKERAQRPLVLHLGKLAEGVEFAPPALRAVLAAPVALADECPLGPCRRTFSATDCRPRPLSQCLGSTASGKTWTARAVRTIKYIAACNIWSNWNTDSRPRYGSLSGVNMGISRSFTVSSISRPGFRFAIPRPLLLVLEGDLMPNREIPVSPGSNAQHPRHRGARSAPQAFLWKPW